MVVWVIGISGSGKSFFAKKILNKIKGKKIHVDGDEVRKYLTYKLGYIKSDRKKNALLISDLCNLLEKKGFIVVCSILSIFKEHQKRNRKIFNKYMQIYLKANIKKVIEKNNKNIYSKKDVVGKQIKFPTHHKSDITIINNFDHSYKKNIKLIVKRLNEKLKNN